MYGSQRVNQVSSTVSQIRLTVGVLLLRAESLTVNEVSLAWLNFFPVYFPAAAATVGSASRRRCAGK